MPIATDLSIEPYFDAYGETSDYYKILFRPGVPVQVRELNELQTMFQKQIERFGDNIFKRGTIVDGCSFAFHSPFAYIKIDDLEVSGPPASPVSYVGKYVKNSGGLRAVVVDYQDGFESTAPDLKTLYINYVNSGDDNITDDFSLSDLLTVYDNQNVLESVTIDNAGSGFSNNDTVVIVSALVVNVTSGSFSVSDQITNLSQANSQIVSIDTTTLASSNQVILTVKPLTADLARANSKSSNWTFSNGEEIQHISDSGIVGTIEGILGENAAGVLRTTAAGRLASVTITNKGSGYTTLPYITVKSANNSAGINAADLIGQNYIAKIRVSSTAGSVGNGYAFSVSDGVIYQRGYFERVEAQRVIVEKYSQSPNNVVVGFTTIEEIIDSDIDTNLLDNALGEPNETAPGANRLKLTPVLTVRSKEEADADDEFFSLVEWSEGRPYKQNQTTEYNKIGDAVAEGIADAAGDYVTNKFLVTTRSPLDSAYEGNTFSIVVDPGTAYVSGHKVETTRNYAVDVSKGLDTKISNNQYISLDYGNYLRIKETAGLFQYSTGDQISLYETAKQMLSNSTTVATGTIAPVGTLIGTARIRSMLHETGIPGTPDATYQLYLFDIRMTSGFNIKNAKSVYYNGTNGAGIADIIQELDGTTNTYITKLQRNNADRLLFNVGIESLKNANLVNYSYRTIDQTLVTANSGLIVKNISADPTEFFPYSGRLSEVQMINDLYVVPFGGSLRANTFITGTANAVSGNVILNGVGSTFLSDLQEGDYVWISANTTGGGDVRRVTRKVSNLRVRLNEGPSFSNTAARVYRYFPKNVPVPFGYRSGLTANVDVNRNILTIDFGMTFANPSVNTAVGINIERQDAVQVTKTPQRNKFVRIKPSNSTSGIMQPAYLKGTLSLTVGSNSVTGTGTRFNTQLTAGETILIETIFNPSGQNAPVSNTSVKQLVQKTIGSITNSTAMTFTTVTANYSNTSITNIKYGKSGSFKGPWCLGVPDAFRLKNVYIGSNTTFDPNDSGVVDVKNQFYIDHNQNQNYLDLSYLYLKPGASIRLSANDVLLVKFDYFTTSGSGFATTASYTSSNSAQIALQDSMSLNELSATAGAVSTFEIPEVYTAKGGYYSLMNSIDFRPSACTVITPSATAASAPINPVYTLSFGNTANPVNDKKFPVPGTSAKMRIEHYLGRTDAVVMDKNGKISVLRGTPETIPSMRVAPFIPNDTIVLNELTVPPYPNIPSNYSVELARVLNTRIASGKYTQRKNAASIIKTRLTEQQIEINQPTRYTMADIGNLERRIQNLEYYTSLSFLESTVKDRLIPSSIDPSINRFKFGFFVDDFDNYKTSDIENPAYSATIERGRVLPPSQAWNSGNDDDSEITCDYENFLIINQENATVKANTPQINCEPSGVTSNAWAVALQSSGSVGKTTKQIVTLSTVSAPATLYAYFRTGHDYIEIYQGNTKLLTANNASALVAADKTKMLSNTIPSSPFAGKIIPADLDKAFTYLNQTYNGDTYRTINNAFKINWTHNPASGTEYTIKVVGFSDDWTYALEYPINSNTVSCNTAPNTNSVVTYAGTLTVDPSTYKFVTGEYKTTTSSYKIPGKGGDIITTTNTFFVATPINKKYTCVAKGLKPNTVHNFLYESRNLNTEVQPLGKSLGDPITTDASGQATFYFYFTDEIEKRVDNLNNVSFKVAGTKLFEVRAKDSAAKALTVMIVEDPVKPAESGGLGDGSGGGDRYGGKSPGESGEGRVDGNSPY